MNQHHNRTAWLLDSSLDTLVVFGMCVWMELLHTFKLVVLNYVILRGWLEMFLPSEQFHKVCRALKVKQISAGQHHADREKGKVVFLD